MIVSSPLAFAPAVRRLYVEGLRPGDPTGWRAIDSFYTVMPGQLTVVTGFPNSGKSEWVDALLLNLMRHDWQFAMFSPENRPVEVHLTKLAEKYIGKPFRDGPTERMTEQERDSAMKVIASHFGILNGAETEVPTAQTVVDAAESWLMSRGRKRGLVIDPWNELDHLRPSGLSETEYISQTLSFVRNWARETNTHVWIVAHPAKQKREDGNLPIPRPDMIAGSMHWWNKADNCIAVVRNYGDENALVDIHVQKVRFKHVGKLGIGSLKYDRVTGQYSDPPLANVAYPNFESRKA